ncbi:MAG: response regulator [Lachnospiraceae bacterium]|nr:response regulator [Lachnospiraceae bacterium]
MNKVLFIGKINETTKDIEKALREHFYVQICPLNKTSLDAMMKVVEPELVILSLVGAYEIDSIILRQLEVAYYNIPVITIGTESERDRFSTFYNNSQFENLLRPIDNNRIIEAVCRRLNILFEVQNAGVKIRNENEKKQILIVDDNVMVLRNLKEMLQAHYDIVVANSGIKAMTAIGKHRPDLILLDYEMPVCDGRQTLEMIRADEDISDIPVIFLTGVSDRAHIEAVLKLNPAGYMLKPPMKKKLLAVISKAIEG